MIPKITALYHTDIFFETDDEETVERSLPISPKPNLADWSLGPGSPASPPYVTIAGSSKVWVGKLASTIYKELEQLGVKFIE